VEPREADSAIPIPADTTGSESSAAFRAAVLRQIGELNADNQRLLQSVVRSEQRFRTLAKSVWHVQEEERRRLARELHDGLGQSLTALANQLQRAVDELHQGSANTPSLQKKLNDALALTRSTLHDSRELSRLLRPTLLDDLGLDAALSWLARTLSERTDLKITVHSTLDEHRLHPDVETLVFRITQEALTNAIRHSAARQVRVQLDHRGRALDLRIEDDGCGFEPLQLPPAGSCSGLRGMRDRAELFGGRVELRSAPGEGTVVQLLLVLDTPDIPATTEPRPIS
jgi:two-component system NarL family sensor kinase